MKHFVSMLLLLFSTHSYAAGCPPPPSSFSEHLTSFRILIVREMPSVIVQWEALATRGMIFFASEFHEGQEIGLSKKSESFIADSLELPSKFNANDFSSIPEGTYDAWVRSDGGKRRIQLIDVPGRSCIQIHSGNSPSEIQGCILPGDEGILIGGQSLIEKDGSWYQANPKQMPDGSWVRVAGEPIASNHFVSVIEGVPVVWNSKKTFETLWRYFGDDLSRRVEVKIVNRGSSKKIKEVAAPMPPDRMIVQ